MKTEIRSGWALALFAVACADGMSGRVSQAPYEPLPPAFPDVYVAPSAESASGLLPPGPRPDRPSDLFSEVPVTGHLEGQLRDIDLSATTTVNSGSVELWEGGAAALYVTIAAEGTPTGAGMLMVSLTAEDITEALAVGFWSSIDPSTNSASTVSVSSCAGPTLGDWSWEIPSVGYEVTASEDPEHPDNVVLVIKGQFPTSETDYDQVGPTSELIGTLTLDRRDLELDP